MPPSMYPGSTGVGPLGPGSASGGGTGAPPSGGSGVGGVSHQHPSHPSAPPSGLGAGGPPTSKPSSVLNTVQLQQLSAQLKAYKLLARNVSPPEALISIVHGRKPTAAMLAALGKQSQSHQQSPHHSPTSMSAPSQGEGQRGTGGTVPSSEGGSGGNISLYPLSPSVSHGGSPAANTAQSQAPVRSTSSLAQSLTSSSSASGGAPNVTISSSGELPLSVKQAISAAQTRSSNTPPSGQQLSTPPTSMSPAPNIHTQVPPPSGSSGQSVPTSQSQSSQPAGSQQQQQQTTNQQQQQQVRAQLKSVKLAPTGKPQGIDPTVIIKEREHRLVVHVHVHMYTYTVYMYMYNVIYSM